MMRTTILVTGVLLLMLSASAVYAQKVELGLYENLHPVINCEGMSSLVYTTETKDTTEAANATVYKRFAVHKSDNNTLSNWPNALTVCSKVGSGWRLPTQRELMLMWVLKRELENTSDFTQFTAGHYWSATEYYNSYSWSVIFKSGSMGYYYKTNAYKVRCVRELMPQAG